MEAPAIHMICVTGPPGTGKTQTIKVLLEGIQRGDYAVFKGVGLNDVDLAALFDGSCACFIQAFSINLQQGHVQSSAEYQLAEYLVSSCKQKDRYKLRFLNKLAKQVTQSDSILGCIPLLVSILPKYLIIGIDEIDRLFSVCLSTSRRQTRLTRHLTPIHFIAELASKAYEIKQARVILVGISNEERLLHDMRGLRLYHDCVHSLPFKPYNFMQLSALVKKRRKPREEEDTAGPTSASLAIEYGTRKVASSTGDCRQILDMLTRLRLDACDPSDTSPTREMTEPATEVTVESVQRILGTTFQTDVSRIVHQIETLTSQQQLIALAVAKLIILGAPATMPTLTGNEDPLCNRVWVRLTNAQDTYRSLCRMMSLQPFSSAGFRNAVDALVVAGLFDIRQDPIQQQQQQQQRVVVNTPSKPRSRGAGLNRVSRDASVSRQRTPVKRRPTPVTPLSPEFGTARGWATSDILGAYGDLTGMAASVTYTVQSDRVGLIVEKTQGRGVVRVFRLFKCPSQGRKGEASSDDDL